MGNNENTIIALSTPPGVSGLAVIRISGKESFSLIEQVFRKISNNTVKIQNLKSHTIHYGKIIENSELIDFVTISIFKNPSSYTGENTIEIGCHGGIPVIEKILSLLIKKGAVQALPGEFTRRAFINGKLDLTQIEAVGDLIHSQSNLSQAAAARQLSGELSKKINKLIKILLDVASLVELGLDFSEENIEFIQKDKILKELNYVKKYCIELYGDYSSSEIIKNGFYLAIAGKPNAGKSSLFNALLNRKRAIVSEIKGTTRDYIEENLIINDINIRLFDTAGLRKSKDIIEIEGILLSKEIIENSNMVIIINDINKGKDNSNHIFGEILKDFPNKEILLLQNKIDKFIGDVPSLSISAKMNMGIVELKKYIYNTAKKSTERTNDVLINKRNATALSEASNYIQNAIESIEFNDVVIAFEIRNAIEKLEEITGERYKEEVLNTIFSNFCIGK